MHDEYGNIDSSGETYICKNFTLENGIILTEAQVRYNVYGSLNDAKDNVLMVCHALTGNSRLDQWWGSMLGPGRPFDTDKYLVVCANALGSCYGTTGPMSINPSTGEVYGMSFPQVTIRDTARLHIQMVREAIGASSVLGVVGGSMGGMHALEWAVLAGDYVRSVVAIATNACHNGWQIAISEAQRQAIYADPKWNNGDVDFNDPPNSGLSVARMVGMISYRTAKGYNAKFGREKDEAGEFQVKRYLQHQGQKILNRFDAITYVKLTEQLDTHDLARGRGSIGEALASIIGRVLIVGIESDMLYPLFEQEELTALIPGSEYRVILSQEGHDGFILEQATLGKFIEDFLDPIYHRTSATSTSTSTQPAAITNNIDLK